MISKGVKLPLFCTNTLKAFDFKANCVKWLKELDPLSATKIQSKESSLWQHMAYGDIRRDCGERMR